MSLVERLCPAVINLSGAWHDTCGLRPSLHYSDPPPPPPPPPRSHPPPGLSRPFSPVSFCSPRLSPPPQTSVCHRRFPETVSATTKAFSPCEAMNRMLESLCVSPFRRHSHTLSVPTLLSPPCSTPPNNTPPPFIPSFLVLLFIRCCTMHRLQCHYRLLHCSRELFFFLFLSTFLWFSFFFLSQLPPPSFGVFFCSVLAQRSTEDAGNNKKHTRFLLHRTNQKKETNSPYLTAFSPVFLQDYSKPSPALLPQRITATSWNNSRACVLVCVCMWEYFCKKETGSGNGDSQLQETKLNKRYSKNKLNQ